MGAPPLKGDKHQGSGLLAWALHKLSGRPRASVPSVPAVTRGEIAAWYAQRIAPALKACVQELHRPAVLVVRCRDEGFLDDLRDGLEAALADVFPCDVLSGWPTTGAEAGVAARETIDALNAGRTRVLVLPNERVLGGTLALVDEVYPLPRFDPPSLSAACQAFLDLPQPPPVPAQPWVGQVTPVDLLITSEARGDPVAAIGAAVQRRLREHDCSDAMPVESLLGLSEAREWVQTLIEDLRDALNPQVRCRWSDIERAVLFAGPRGVGRSSLSRAIARATGMRWITVSARDWVAALESERYQDRGERRASTCAMERDFDRARELAPAVLHIQDFGSLPADLALELGQHIARHDDREPLFIVGSCADDDVPADEVRRRANIEHTVYLPLPSALVLAHRLNERLGGLSHRLSEVQLRQLGRLAIGGTAADLDRHIRRAQKMARRSAREVLDFDDLAAAILETPSASSRPKISESELSTTAFHEAGHAVVQYLEMEQGRHLQYITIVPRRMDGGTSLGFVLRMPDEDRFSSTRAEILALIRSYLGGRAAEELMRGPEHVTTGAGGSVDSDLAAATRLASNLIGRCGLGSGGSLVFRLANIGSDAKLLRQVDHLLRSEYRRTLGLLRAKWHLVEELANRLLQEQEMSGDEVRAVLDAASRQGAGPAPGLARNDPAPVLAPALAPDAARAPSGASHETA